MALTPAPVVAALLVVACAWPCAARAEDSRITKAREIRDDILAKRAAPGRVERTAPPPMEPEEFEDPFDAAIRAARARLAELEARLESTRQRSLGLASPRQKLAERGDELTAQVARLQAGHRARVEAIYRSARIGGRAAGSNAGGSDSARLSRYLAAVAAAGQQEVAQVEIEHGSVVAALDRARAEDAAIAAEVRALEADRVEAEASLRRATDEAAIEPDETVAAIAAREAAEARFDEQLDQGRDEGDAVDGGEASDEVEKGADVEAQQEQEQAEADDAQADDHIREDLERLRLDAIKRQRVAEDQQFALEASARAKAATAEARDKEASAREVERALAEADRKLRADSANAASAADANVARKAVAGNERAAGAAGADTAATGDDFRWPASEEARPAGTKPAATTGAGAAPDAAASKAAGAAPDAVASKAAGAATAAIDDGIPAVPDEPTGLAPAEPAPEPAAAPPDGAVAGKPKGFLSRFFGGDDRESDRFASARGGLPPPVAGKVVANYGQQHKSGSTYRGVILRAGHNAPIRSVAEGRVSFVGEVPGLGKTVIVSHGSRYHTVYARLGAVEVKEGDKVSGGAEVGVLPDNDADMHFELRDKGKAVDPLPWLRGATR